METFRKHAIKVIGAFLIDGNVFSIEEAIFDVSEDSETRYRNILYDVVVDIQRGQSVEVTLDMISKRKIEWQHPEFDDTMFRQREQDEFIKNPFEVAEGVLKCPKCSKSRTFSYQKQTRSADEPMTTFATCMGCKHKWVYSG